MFSLGRCHSLAIAFLHSFAWFSSPFSSPSEICPIELDFSGCISSIGEQKEELWTMALSFLNCGMPVVCGLATAAEKVNRTFQSTSKYLAIKNGMLTTFYCWQRQQGYTPHQLFTVQAVSSKLTSVASFMTKLAYFIRHGQTLGFG